MASAGARWLGRGDLTESKRRAVGSIVSELFRRASPTIFSSAALSFRPNRREVVNWSPKDASYTEIPIALSVIANAAMLKAFRATCSANNKTTEVNNRYSRSQILFLRLWKPEINPARRNQLAVRTVAERKLGEAGCHSCSLESRIIAKKLLITFWHDLCSLSRLE